MTVERGATVTRCPSDSGRTSPFSTTCAATGIHPTTRVPGGTEVDETISFLFGGEWSEYPLKSTVPISTGRAAIKTILRTGQLLESVVWEEV